MRKIIGTAALLLSLSGAAFAGNESCRTVWVFGIIPWQECQPVIKHDPHLTVAPEFDGATAAGAVTLLAGGLAIFLGRRRSKLSA